VSVERGTATKRPGRAADASWRIRGEVLALDRPVVVGVLNATPDSFSDGGLHLEPAAAVDRAWRMIEEGAGVIDVGGESTRPGADPVPAAEQWRRIEPVLSRASELPVPLSVDTTELEVASRALEAGAAILNDVSGLRFEPRLAELAAESGAGLILMHMRGDPRTMQDDVAYDDLLGEVRSALERSIGRALERGCGRDQLVVDPGIGFGKSAAGNLELIARLRELEGLGAPILVGPSRKSFIGKVLDLPVDQREEGTVAACVMALDRGARLFRVHDPRRARRALDLAEAIRRAGDGPRPDVRGA